ncbi:MAG: hypothetical protein KatS3mg108_0754 [Isosphaeraceae bacterium]|jgi:hypothetical protein|nr:MAG: hypothetical protein KatS3mg108_0754 [Isosphaeraceae bacterium]
MTDQANTERGAEPGETSLSELARLLRDVDHLEPQVRRELADVVEELDSAVRGELNPDQAAHLRQSVAHLVETIRSQRETGLVANARQQLEATLVRTETEAPVASGVARRLIEMIADLGI